MSRSITFLLFLTIATQSIPLHAMYRNQQIRREHWVRNVNLAGAIACFAYSFYTISGNSEKRPDDAWCDTIRALGVGASGCFLLVNTIIADGEIFRLRNEKPPETP
jgi:hypothetical protein